MENPQIGKVIISGYELIDSRIINLFKPQFDVFIENLTFHFEFIDLHNERVKIELEKLRGDDVFDIRIFNFEAGGLQGFFTPMPIGEFDKTKYYFSISGLPHENRHFKSIIFNLFQEAKTDEN